jgi:hypothetical protein
MYGPTAESSKSGQGQQETGYRGDARVVGYEPRREDLIGIDDRVGHQCGGCDSVCRTDKAGTRRDSTVVVVRDAVVNG